MPKKPKNGHLGQIYFVNFINSFTFFFSFLVSKEAQLNSRAVARGSLVAGVKDMS